MQATRAVQLSGFDLMFLTETNIIDQSYCRNILGCNVVCLSKIKMEAVIAQGGLGLIVRGLPQGWSIESTRFHEKLW